MKGIKLPTVIVALAMLLVVAACALAADTPKADTPKTVTGKSTCGGCTGVVKGCCLLLTDKDGVRWILRGKSEGLKAAFEQRHSGKTMTATLAGKPATKKGKDGKDYKEVKVSEVKIKS